MRFQPITTIVFVLACAVPPRLNAAAVEWGAAVTSAAIADVSGVSVDGDGNVFAAGNFVDSLTIGSELLLTDGFAQDFYLSKFTDAGSLVWVVRSHSAPTSIARVNAVSADPWGDVYVAGEFRDTTTVGDSTFVSGTYDPFLAKFAGDGTFLWAAHIEGQDDNFANDVATDAGGHVFVTGDFRLGLQFPDTLLLCGGASCRWAASYEGDGTFRWASGGASGIGTAIAADPSGHCYVAEGSRYPPRIVELDTGGGEVRAESLQMTFTLSNANIVDLACDDDGDVYMTGWFWGTVGLDSISLSTSNVTDAFAARYGADGTFRWAVGGSGSGSNNAASGVAVDADKQCYISGHFAGTLDLGDTVLTRGLSPTYFAACYDSSGTLEWAEQATGSGTNAGSSIAVGGAGVLAAGGTFFSGITVATTTLNALYGPSQDGFVLVRLIDTPSAVRGPGVASGVVLEPNVPNPFNPITTIAFTITRAGSVRLSIYDVAGRRVRSLVDEARPEGHYRAYWDGVDERGARAASGVYFAVLESGGVTAARKLVLLK
jgi:hypothetical protein